MRKKMTSAEVICCAHLLALFVDLSMKTNSVDPDQTPSNEISDLGLYCLSRRRLMISADEVAVNPGHGVIKLFSCSTQLSTEFQQLIKLKYRQIKTVLALSLSNVVYIFVGILTFLSKLDFHSQLS